MTHLPTANGLREIYRNPQQNWWVKTCKNPWFPKILPFTHPLNFARKLSNLSGVFDARRAMECCAALSCVALSFNLGRRDFRTRCRKIWDMGEG
jgi:hypothetical protein